MKISVILPCYNAERYLNACFESLFAQSMRDFEVIFIDDGSLDGSLAIARRCAGRDDRIRVFAQENQGVSAARNLDVVQCPELIIYSLFFRSQRSLFLWSLSIKGLQRAHAVTA